MNPIILVVKKIIYLKTFKNFCVSSLAVSVLFLTIAGCLGPGVASAAPGGIDWTAQNATEVNQWYSVAYGNGTFVAVSMDGAHQVMTSPDGVTWTPHTAAEANYWTSVTYGNGLFVAVAGAGAGAHFVMTSTNGVSWTARTAAENNNWRSVAYGNGIFVAVSIDGAHEVMRSTNGTTWTAATSSEQNQWASVTYGNGLFVAVSQNGTHRIMTSPDGVTWTAQTATEVNGWYSVVYGNGMFVAVSYDGTHRVMTSTDGVTWEARSAAEASQWVSITYGDGLFVAIAYPSGTHQVMTSPNGISWTAQTATEANQWISITYGNGTFVAVSNNGTHRIMTSPSIVHTLASDYITVTLDVISGISITSPDDVTMSRNLSMTADTAVASSTWTVRTSNETGYNLTVKASTAPAMHNATNTVDDYQTTGTPDTWSVSAGTAAFGFSAYGTDVAAAWGSDTSCQASSDVPSSNLKYSGFTTSTSSPVVSTRSATTSSDGVATTVCYAVGQNAYYIPSGTYTATITATAVNL